MKDSPGAGAVDPAVICAEEHVAEEGNWGSADGSQVRGVEPTGSEPGLGHGYPTARPATRPRPLPEHQTRNLKPPCRAGGSPATDGSPDGSLLVITRPESAGLPE